MIPVQLDEDSLEVTLAGKTVALLPKEFALFRFLFLHQQQAFTREALLDRVWPLEEPVDRTVDDHIYRLRKKLKIWEPYFVIETVRGTGYRLHITAPQKKVTPSLLDEGFQQQFTQILTKYHLYGQGEAMQALAAQQQILGAKLDPFYDMYTELLKGNWDVLLKETILFWERAYFMIVLYGLLEDDPFAGKNIMESALRNDQLPLPRLWELQAIDLVFCYVWCGEFEAANEKSVWAYEKAVEHELEGFKPAIQIQQIYPLYMTGNVQAAEKLIAEIDTLLTEKPYLRELSYYHISKGLCAIRSGDIKSGSDEIAVGVEIMKQAKFELQYLHAITHLSHTLKHLLGGSHRMTLQYQNLRADLIHKNKGNELKKRFLKELTVFL